MNVLAPLLFFLLTPQAFAQTVETDLGFCLTFHGFKDQDAEQLARSSIVPFKCFATVQHRRVSSLISDRKPNSQLMDRIKLFLPGYYELTLRGNVKGVPILWGGLGTNLDQQRIALWTMEFSDYKSALTAIVDKLLKDDPIIATTFLDAIEGQTSRDIEDKDVLSYFQIGALLLLAILVGLNAKSISQRGLRMTRPAAQHIHNNPLALAISAFACIVVGFFAAHGYASYWGILGSIPYMAISIGPFELPFRWLLVVCLVALFYSAWLLLRTKKRVS
jgi:hypothetical protein